ncbi:hypothetical protein C8R43DRAFT_958961 [Mycena crocata]|nr:hypothetical protein C8R43DRAFT_958961 [Mycena crocata]
MHFSGAELINALVPEGHHAWHHARHLLGDLFLQGALRHAGIRATIRPAKKARALKLAPGADRQRGEVLFVPQQLPHLPLRLRKWVTAIMQGSIDGTYVTRAQHWRKHHPLHCRGQLRAIVLVTSHTPVNRRVRVTRLWPERTGPVPVKRPVDPSAMATGESPTTNMSKVLQWPGPKHVNNVTAKTSMMSRAGSISRKSYETKEYSRKAMSLPLRWRSTTDGYMP